MLKIRLQKTGKKNAPSYRIVLCEHTSPPQGKFIEILGHYNPRLKQKGFKKERIEYWISKGAQASPTVHNLLVGEGIVKGNKVKAWRPKKRAEAPASAEATADKKSSDLSAEADKAKAEAPSEAKSEGGKEQAKPEAKEEKPVEESKIEESKEPKLDPVRLSEVAQEPKKDSEKSNGVDK